MFRLLSKLSAKNSKFRTFAYNYLLRTSNKSTKRWEKAWKKIVTKNTNLPVKTVIHGYNALISAGFTYPLYMRRYKKFNNPLVQLAYQTFITNNRPVNIIDVGAAIGDTAFLLNANMPGGINKMLCIDGDDIFFKYLQANMQQFSFVTCVKSFLSSGATEEKELIRTHSGTASAQGDNLVTAKPLDHVVLENNFTEVDVLKIDVDGFDGKVLAGAKTILQYNKPNVIFEWHPILINQTNNNIRECFEVLTDVGYEHFLFFTKTGYFSHYSYKIDTHAIAFLETLCMEGKFEYDWHYDVIALPINTQLNMQELAAGVYANNKKSPF